MGQCTSGGKKISIKKVMKNTITQFIDKTEYLVQSFELLTDAYGKLKEDIFEIINLGSNNNNDYQNYHQKEENRLDLYQQQQQLKSQIYGATEKSTIVVIMSLSSLPDLVNNAELDEKQQLELIRFIERFQECVKCLRALRSSCCKALQRQEIGWQNYQIVQQPCASPKKCSNLNETKSERVSTGSPAKLMGSPQKHCKSSPLENQYNYSSCHNNHSHQKKDNYIIKREICARKLLIIIESIDKLQQSYDFDYIISMVKEIIQKKYDVNCKLNNVFKNLDDGEIEKQFAAAIASEQQKKQEILQTIVKDLSESEIF
ncbi:hypothetical protein ABPG72_021636 [Tetrahymena utriculariae]